MKQLLVLSITFYLLLLACKKNADPVVNPEGSKTTTVDQIPDSLLTGGGVVGKWKLDTINVPGAAPQSKVIPDVVLIFTNRDSLIVTNDIDKSLSLHLNGLAKGKYSYSYFAKDSANNPNTNLYWENNKYKFFSLTTIGTTVWYSHVSDSILWMYPHISGPFYTYKKIK